MGLRHWLDQPDRRGGVQGVRSSGLAIGGKTGLWKAEGQDDRAALTLAASSLVAGRLW